MRVKKMFADSEFEVLLDVGPVDTTTPTVIAFEPEALLAAVRNALPSVKSLERTAREAAFGQQRPTASEILLGVDTTDNVGQVRLAYRPVNAGNPSKPQLPGLQNPVQDTLSRGIEDCVKCCIGQSSETERDRIQDGSQDPTEDDTPRGEDLSSGNDMAATSEAPGTPSGAPAPGASPTDEVPPLSNALSVSLARIRRKQPVDVIFADGTSTTLPTNTPVLTVSRTPDRRITQTVIVDGVIDTAGCTLIIAGRQTLRCAFDPALQLRDVLLQAQAERRYVRVVLEPISGQEDKRGDLQTTYMLLEAELREPIGGQLPLELVPLTLATGCST